MKKLALFLVCSLLASGAVAQKRLVDEVNKDISGYTPDFKAARDKLKPALTNAESMNDAQTWFVAGKTEMGLYDNLMAQKRIGQKVDEDVMCNALLSANNFLQKALPLDSVAEKQKDGTLKLDKKGNPKIKTKYSKDIIALIVSHHNDFSNVASIFYDAKKYGKAYDCWEVFSELPNATFLGKNKPVIPDTIVGQVKFYQGIAAWQDNDNAKAVKSFALARKNGYVKKEAYDYAMSCLVTLKDNDGVVAIAKEAFPIYGSQDTQYIAIMINDYINKSNYAEADKLLDSAIAANPNNAEFYNVKGTLFESQKDTENALKYFAKAIELKPEYAKGQFDVGRYYYNKAIQMRDDVNKLKGTEYQKAVSSKLNPLYKQALPHLEKAYQLDPENKDAKNALKNIYYFLGDETKLNALEKGY
ncbi:MAG: tetratricopeptide repeat protein [Muribaculaceae bacterium]